MRRRLFLGAVLTCSSLAASARADDEVASLEQSRAEAFSTRRALATSVLVAGGVGIVGGGVLMIPSGDDKAWRFAGINTAVFGVVNTVVGLRALFGIRAEERAWDDDAARAARRTPAGLAAARAHAAEDERRESVGHAINLGLDIAYLGVGGTAVLASQVGADHPNRWLASGVAIGVQSAFLLGVDLIGLSTSADYHRAVLANVAPVVSFSPTPHGNDWRVGVGAAF